jgi:Resolvase, N terminal domain
VSTDKQTTTQQIAELLQRPSATAGKWSGSTSTTASAARRGARPAAEARRDAEGAVRRKFDIVAAMVGRSLSRSLQHLVGLLEEIHGKGIDLHLHQQERLGRSLCLEGR